MKNFPTKTVELKLLRRLDSLRRVTAANTVLFRRIVGSHRWRRLDALLLSSSMSRDNSVGLNQSLNLHLSSLSLENTDWNHVILMVLMGVGKKQALELHNLYWA